MAENKNLTIETRRAQMFPTLQPAEIDRLRRFGEIVHFKSGEVIVHAGEPSHGVYLILSGEIRIAPHEVHRQAETIVTHGPGSFMGELAQLSGRPALVDSIAESDVEAVVIPPPRVRELMIAEADIGERIMRALILRRVGLLEQGVGGPVIVGDVANRDVLRLAMNIVHRPEDARDIYQETFLKVYRNLHRFRFECSFYTWLYRVATNVGLDYLRRRTTRREDQAPVPEDTEGASTRDFFDRQPQQNPSTNPERQLLGHEISGRIHEAMKRLSPRERMVFEMKHYEGMRLRAIGDVLGTSEETVKNSLFRATRKLRASLEGLR